MAAKSRKSLKSTNKRSAGRLPSPGSEFAADRSQDRAEETVRHSEKAVEATDDRIGRIAPLGPDDAAAYAEKAVAASDSASRAAMAVAEKFAARAVEEADAAVGRSEQPRQTQARRK